MAPVLSISLGSLCRDVIGILSQQPSGESALQVVKLFAAYVADSGDSFVKVWGVGLLFHSPLLFITANVLPSTNVLFTRWNAVLQKRLAWDLLVLFLSALVYCQPTELILGFFLFLIQFYPPPQVSMPDEDVRELSWPEVGRNCRNAMKPIRAKLGLPAEDDDVDDDDVRG